MSKEVIKFKVGDLVKFDQEQSTLIKHLAEFKGNLKVVGISSDITLGIETIMVELEGGIYYPQEWLIKSDGERDHVEREVKFTVGQKVKVVENMLDFHYEKVTSGYFATLEMIKQAGKVVEISLVDEDLGIVEIKGMENTAWTPEMLEVMEEEQNVINRR